MSVFLVEVNEGMAGLALEDISAILPDLTQPEEKSTVFTALFPGGITVKGDSDRLIGMWMALLKEARAENEDEDE